MKILFVSLGCDKNLVDSEAMLGLLGGTAVTTFTDDETEADVIVVNTCCFINDAKEESVNTILEMAEYRKSGRVQGADRGGMSGPAVSRRRSLEEIEEVDAVLGTASYEDIAESH